MKIVVAGGSGFIGSHVVDVLLEQGHEVLIYDLEAPRYGQSCAFVRGDTRDIDRMAQVFKRGDIVYMLAAEANVNRFFESPLFSNDITANGTLSVLEAARRIGVARVMLASTEWVYGSLPEAGEESITEDTPCTGNPDHIYTSSKIASELYCRNYQGLGGKLLDEEAPLNPVSLYARTKIESEKIILDMGDEYFSPTILRMGTLYGYSPRMRFDLVVNTMTMKSFVEGRIQVFGGKQWRPLLGVEDAADVYIRCLEANLQDVGNRIFNVGSDDQNYQIDEVAEIIGTALGGIPVSRDSSNLDTCDYCVSFSKLKQTLGFVPQQTIRNAACVILDKLNSGVIRNPAQRIYYNHYFDSAEE